MPDPELPEDACEVAFHRPVGHEERSGDLLVRLAFDDEYGDALFGGRERAGRGCTAADPLELRSSSLGPQSRADVLEGRESFLEGLARLAAALHPALRRTEGQERASAIEREVQLRMKCERLLERGMRSLHSSRLGGEETSTAPAVRNRRRTPEPECVAL